MRVRVGAVEVDVVNSVEALAAVDALVTDGRGGTVFTPNVDHVVRAKRELSFRQAYARARLSLPDGQPIVWTARLSGVRLLHRVTGADLFVPLLTLAAERRWGVYIVGGRIGAKQRLVERLARELPSLRITIGSPTRIIAGEEARLADEVAAIRALRPELVLVCLGSPLQELWSDRIASEVTPAVLVGLGSAMDVAVGMQARAPVWMQRSGLEWLFRLATEPRRLWRRYLVDGVHFLPIAIDSVRKNRTRH